jgi:hypothetical protein
MHWKHARCKIRSEESDLSQRPTDRSHARNWGGGQEAGDAEEWQSTMNEVGCRTEGYLGVE